MRPRPQDCRWAQPICGPFYQEENIYHGPGRFEDTPDAFSLALEEHHSSWYQFETSDSGWLQFSIVPDGPHTDFDWALWRLEEEGSVCELIKKESLQPLATNFASGSGLFGSTGMDETGMAFHESVLGRPYSKAVRVQPDEVFYLMVDAYGGVNGRFHIRFSDNVYTCIQPERDLISLKRKERKSTSIQAQRNHFMQRTQLTRIPLTGTYNAELLQCRMTVGSFEKLEEAGKVLDASVSDGAGLENVIEGERSLPEVLLMGVRLGLINAYSCEDLRTPVHIGDILHAAWETGGDPGFHEGTPG